MSRLKTCSTTPLQDRIIESRDKLYRIAFSWCGDSMIADDVVQETLAIAMKKHTQLREESKMFGWICRIMKNNWYRQIRKQKNHDSIDDHLMQVPTEEKGPLGNYQESDTIMQVRRAVNQLPLEQRQVLSLVDLGELSYCDVAKALDVPVGTVMSRLHIARKNLLNKLEINERRTGTSLKRNMRVI